MVLLLAIAANHASAESEWDQTSVSVNKEWKIQFNTQLLENTITENTIYVKDSNGNKVDTIELEYNENEKSVTVENTEEYQLNQSYTLHISSGVKSLSILPISNEVTMEFVTEGSSSNPGAPSGGSDDSNDNDSDNSSDEPSLNEITSPYEKEFNQLEEEANTELNKLADSAQEELDNGASMESVINKYSEKAETLEAETDEQFNSIYNELVAELEENGYSESDAEPFEEEYEEEKSNRKSELIKRFL